jgi:hypothetical protein
MFALTNKLWLHDLGLTRSQNWFDCAHHHFLPLRFAQALGLVYPVVHNKIFKSTEKTKKGTRNTSVKSFMMFR